MTAVEPAGLEVHLCPWCAQQVGELAPVCPSCKTPLSTDRRALRSGPEPLSLVRFGIRGLVAAAVVRVVVGILVAFSVESGTRLGAFWYVQLLVFADAASHAALLVGAAALLSLAARYVELREGRAGRTAVPRRRSGARVRRTG